jgi:hypothetical protein
LDWQQAEDIFDTQHVKDSANVHLLFEQTFGTVPVQHVEAESRLQQVLLYEQAALDEHSL